MSKGTVVAEIFRRVGIEQCAICGEKTKEMLVHLAIHHRGVEKHSELYWLNRHEVIYNGRLYSNEQRHIRQHRHAPL